MSRTSHRGPSLWAAVRTAATDLADQSWRLVAVNLAWGIMLIVVLALWASVGTVASLLALPLLGIPLAGLARLCGLIVRGRNVVLSDAWAGAWSRRRAILGLAACQTIGVTVFATNIVVGLESASIVGWSIATMAGWGLVAMWVYSVVAWPILMDPERPEMASGERLRLAGLLAFAFPVRMGLFALLLAVFLAVSTVAFVALITVSVAFAMLLSAHHILPAADRLAGR